MMLIAQMLKLIIGCPLIAWGISLFDEIAWRNVVVEIIAIMAFERSVNLMFSLILIKVRIDLLFVGLYLDF